MNVCRALFGAAVPANAANAMAGVHPPEIEQQLSFLAQDWTIEGYEGKYRETCTWYAERSFVVCDSLDETEATPARSVSIFGWSAQTSTFTYHHYAQNGRSRTEPCFANERGGLTCVGERRTDTGLIQFRSHIWPVPGGAEFRSERSENGGPWSETTSLKYIPRKL